MPILPDAIVIAAVYAVAPALFVGAIACAILAGVALGWQRHTVRVEREADRRWQDVAAAIDDILAEPWPEAEAVTGPIEVVTTGPVPVVEVPPESLAPLEACAHLSTLDRLDGRRCPECDPR